MHNVVIIGSGCAGLTAAIYAARANLKPLIIDGYEPGGQLTLTTMVENFPGFPEGILGPELIELMRKQAQRFGAEFRAGAVTGVDFSKRPFHITVGKEHFPAKTVIVAAGAIFLTRFASRVHLIHRRREFRATKIMLDRAHANAKIHFITPAVVDDISDVGKTSVEAILLRNPETEQKSELLVEGVFVAIGHEPNTKVFRSILDMDENGYVSTRNGTKTNIQGVFAAGDVQDHHYRQAVTAAGSGCMAAMDAEKFLEATGH